MPDPRQMLADTDLPSGQMMSPLLLFQVDLGERVNGGEGFGFSRVKVNCHLLSTSSAPSVLCLQSPS